MTAVRTRTRATIDARIAGAALPGFQTVTRAALRDVGVDDRAIRRRIEDGRLHVVWGVTLLIGVAPEHITPDQLIAAALVTVGRDAELDGLSALERRELWDRHDGGIHVTSRRSHDAVDFPTPVRWRASRRWKRRPRCVRIRFTKSNRPTKRLSTLIDGIPTRSAIDALFRAAGLLTPLQLAHVIARGEFRHEFTIEDIELEARRRRIERSPGLPNVRAAIELRRSGSAGTKSKSEDISHPHLATAFGAPLVNVRGSAGIPGYEPDFCWPAQRWIVEIDGPHHDEDPEQRAADLARDEMLRAVGWIVERIHWARVWDDMRGVMADVTNAFCS